MTTESTLSQSELRQKAAKEYVKGNGEVVGVKDITGEYLISEARVISALKKAKFEHMEIDFITRCLYENGITSEINPKAEQEAETEQEAKEESEVIANA